MNKKILQVFYGVDALPYKDKERTVHFPIVGNAIQNANNTTQIKFYFDRLIEENEQTTFVAVSKLPNGKIGSKILETYDDEEFGEQYALLDLDSFYTQYKGDVFISLQGYQGGVRVEQDEQGIYQIYGTPVIAATGSIKLAINYAPSFVGSGEIENVTLQQVLGELSTKLGVRQETLHVEELPTVGNPDVWYVVNDDEDDPNKQNIYIWNATTQTYVWVGDNTLDLGNYYTKEEGEQFESDINNRVLIVESELSSVASGSPKGVYETLEDLQTAYPTGTDGIYVVSYDGHWYYWNGSAWADGGQYLSADFEECMGLNNSNGITAGYIQSQLDFSKEQGNGNFVVGGGRKGYYFNNSYSSFPSNDNATLNATMAYIKYDVSGLSKIHVKTKIFSLDYINKYLAGAFFTDSSDNFISATMGNGNVTTTYKEFDQDVNVPNGAKYAYVSGSLTATDILSASPFSVINLTAKSFIKDIDNNVNKSSLIEPDNVIDGKTWVCSSSTGGTYTQVNMGGGRICEYNYEPTKDYYVSTFWQQAVSGYYPCVVYLDSNNTPIGFDTMHSSSANTILDNKRLLNIPTGTAKIQVVRRITGSSPTQYNTDEYPHACLFSFGYSIIDKFNKVDTELEKITNQLDGSNFIEPDNVEDGYAYYYYNAGSGIAYNKIAMSGGRICEYEYDNTKEYYVSTYWEGPTVVSSPNFFPAVVYFDENDNAIGSELKADTANVSVVAKNFKLTIPEGTAKIKVIRRVTGVSPEEYKTDKYPYSCDNQYGLSVDDKIGIVEEEIKNASTITNSILYQKKIMGVGDSLLYGGITGPQITWFNKMGIKYSMTYSNKAVSGMTLAGNTNSMVTNIDTYLGSVTALDYFVLEGGANDRAQNIPIAQFKTAIETIINKVRHSFPKCKILCLTNYMRRPNNVNTLGLYDKDYVDAMIEECALLCVPCYDNYRNLGLNLDNADTRLWADEGYWSSGTDNYHFSPDAYDWMENAYIKLLESL